MAASTDIPIVFVQAGGSKAFLDIALRQAVLASPSNEIILLTDTLRPDIPQITQISLADYSNATAQFEGIYRHTSVNDIHYERFCFARWFSVREFVGRRGIDRFCILDSDILLFSPVASFVAEFAGYEAGNWTWANVITAAALDLMCDHFEAIFRDRRLRRAIAEKYRIGSVPHLSDMTALFELASGNPAFLEEHSLVAKGFDDDIHSSGGGLFVMDGPIKSLTIGADGIPLARRTSDNAAVPLRFVHFAGKAKALMAKFTWHRAPKAWPA